MILCLVDTYNYQNLLEGYQYLFQSPIVLISDTYIKVTGNHNNRQITVQHV